MAAAAIISAIAALGSSIYGAYKSSQAQKRAEQLIQKQRDENKRWYEIKMAEDYTQRADVQAAIKRQRELLDEQYRNARKSAAVTGATDESVALQQQAANDSLSKTMTDVAAQSTNYKDSVERQYRSQDAALNQQQSQQQSQHAAQTAQAASQAVNAGINAVGQFAGEIGSNNAPSHEYDQATIDAWNNQLEAEEKKQLSPYFTRIGRVKSAAGDFPDPVLPSQRQN